MIYCQVLSVGLAAQSGVAVLAVDLRQMGGFSTGTESQNRRVCWGQIHDGMVILHGSKRRSCEWLKGLLFGVESFQLSLVLQCL